MSVIQRLIVLAPVIPTAGTNLAMTLWDNFVKGIEVTLILCQSSIFIPIYYWQLNFPNQRN